MSHGVAGGGVTGVVGVTGGGDVDVVIGAGLRFESSASTAITANAAATTTIMRLSKVRPPYFALSKGGFGEPVNAYSNGWNF